MSNHLTLSPCRHSRSTIDPYRLKPSMTKEILIKRKPRGRNLEAADDSFHQGCIMQN